MLLEDIRKSDVISIHQPSKTRMNSGRSGQIRTADLLHPKQALWTKLSYTPFGYPILTGFRNSFVRTFFLAAWLPFSGGFEPVRLDLHSW